MAGCLGGGFSSSLAGGGGVGYFLSARERSAVVIAGPAGGTGFRFLRRVPVAVVRGDDDGRLAGHNRTVAAEGSKTKGAAPPDQHSLPDTCRHVKPRGRGGRIAPWSA